MSDVFLVSASCGRHSRRCLGKWSVSLCRSSWTVESADVVGIRRSFHGGTRSSNCVGGRSAMMSAISMSVVVDFGRGSDRHHDCVGTNVVVVAMRNSNSIVVWSFPMKNLVYLSMWYWLILCCVVVLFVQVLRLV